MHIHYFQHDHFEDLGYIGEWAASHDITTSVTRFDIKPEFPLHEEYDWLVVLGGKMGVNDSDQFPWITAEIEFIKESIQLKKNVLGICLGSQLVASALGARVYKNQKPEMGFFPVTFNRDAQTDKVFRHFPAELKVMHMHFDIFDVPQAALAMASSNVSPCQAFRDKTAHRKNIPSDPRIPSSKRATAAAMFEIKIPVIDARRKTPHRRMLCQA